MTPENTFMHFHKSYYEYHGSLNRAMHIYDWNVRFLDLWRCIIRSWHWRRNGRDGVLNYQLHHCLPNRLFRRRSKKASKVRVTGLCGNQRWPVNSPHKWPVTRKMFLFDDVIMCEWYIPGSTRIRFVSPSWLSHDLHNDKVYSVLLTLFQWLHQI